MLAQAFIRQGLPTIDVPEAPQREGAAALKLLVDCINGDKHAVFVQEQGMTALAPLKSANSVATKDNADDFKPEWRLTDAGRAGLSSLAHGPGWTRRRRYCPALTGPSEQAYSRSAFMFSTGVSRGTSHPAEMMCLGPHRR